MRVQVLTLGLTALSLVTADRITVSIDFGWRYIPDPNGPAHGGNAHGPVVNSTAPPANAKFAQPGFEDSTWAVVDIPHDATVTGDYAPHEDGGEGFLPLARTWYRKKLSIPVRVLFTCTHDNTCQFFYAFTLSLSLSLSLSLTLARNVNRPPGKARRSL